MNAGRGPLPRAGRDRMESVPSRRIGIRHCASSSWRGRAFPRHCEAAQPPKQSGPAAPRVTREAGAPPCPPSLRGGEAAEAIQAGCAASDGREAYRVAAPNSGLLRARFARARNDGGTIVARARNDGGPTTVIARRRSRRSNPGGRCRESCAGGVPCGPAGSGLLRARFARARNDGGAVVPRVARREAGAPP